MLILVLHPQSKKTYEQKCRDKEEADQNVNRNTNTNNTKHMEKVQRHIHISLTLFTPFLHHFYLNVMEYI